MAARWGALSLLLALAAWKMDWSGVMKALGDSSWGLLGLAAAASLASGVSKAMTWQGLLAGMPSARGHSRPGDLISPLLVGALVNSVALARAGDVVKIMLARRLMARRGVTVPYTDLTGSMMAEHVVATVAWAALVGGIAIFQPMPIPIWLTVVSVGLACLGFAVLTALRPPGPPGSRVGHGDACWRRSAASGRASTTATAAWPARGG
jgi:hypothetical protein